MIEINVRGAKEQDVDSLVKFNRAIASETEGRELDPEVLRKGVEAVVADSQKGFYLIAEVGEVAVGTLMVTTEWSDWRNGDFWWLQSVYVEKDFRRKGVFSRLCDEVNAMAKKADRVCGCRLYVEKDNRIAQAVYHERGFQESEYLLYEKSDAH